MAEQPDLTKLSGEFYRHWEKAVGDWWDRTLETPAVLGAMGDGLATQTRARHAWEQKMDENLSAMHLPSKKDVVRLARVAGLLEDKLLALEDRLLALDDRFASLEKETLKARIESAEARLAVVDRISALEDRIGALTATLQTRKEK